MTTKCATNQGKPTGYGACPTYLFARWHECRRGGEKGYRDFGYALMRGAAGAAPDDFDDDDWQMKLDELESLFDNEDDAGIISWFERYLPRLMSLVPARRRHQLLAGMLAAAEVDDSVVSM